MTTKITSQLTASGPFFTKDVSETFLQNVRRMMSEMADAGAADVQQQLAQGESSRAELSIGGRTADRVLGRVARLEGGVQWRYHMVVSPTRSGLSAKDAIALYAGAAEAEREVHAFRHTRSAMRIMKPVLTADLTAGLE